MKKTEEGSGNLLNLMLDWQAVEAGTIEHVNRELPRAKNPLTAAVLSVLRLDAERNCRMQQIIVDSIMKEAVHLTPEELGELSSHLNRYIEEEEKALCRAEAAVNGNELPVPRYLLSYMVEDMKKKNEILRQFDDELKNASIPTSASSRRYGTHRAA